MGKRINNQYGGGASSQMAANGLGVVSAGELPDRQLIKNNSSAQMYGVGQQGQNTINQTSSANIQGGGMPAIN